MTRGPSKQFDTEVALEQAMKVFWAYGYEATSLSELLKRMGIGKKSLYDTFGNKQSLFLKALEHYAHTNIRDLRTRLEAEGSPLGNLKSAGTVLPGSLAWMRSQVCQSDILICSEAFSACFNALLLLLSPQPPLIKHLRF